MERDRRGPEEVEVPGEVAAEDEWEVMEWAWEATAFVPVAARPFRISGEFPATRRNARLAVQV